MAKTKWEFLQDGWASKAAPFGRCGSIPGSPGVYMIVEVRVVSRELKKVKYKILYIGSSKNLLHRYEHHSLWPALRDSYMGNYCNFTSTAIVCFYHKETETYREEEMRLIRKFHPKYNKILYNGKRRK